MVLAKTQLDHFSTLPTPKHRHQCQALTVCDVMFTYSLKTDRALSLEAREMLQYTR